MKTYIAFLRGINVGGRRQIKMDALKQVHVTLGHESVHTYLQTGNVIFQCPTDPKKLVENWKHPMRKPLGFIPTCCFVPPKICNK